MEKKITRSLNKKGEPDLFAGPYNNSRDPMVMHDNGFYYCYYMGHTDKNGMLMENGEDQLNTQYASANPLDFGVGSDNFLYQHIGRRSTGNYLL